MKVEEVSVKFFLRKQSQFPLGSWTGPEFVLRKPSWVKITEYKGGGLQDAAFHNTCRSRGRQAGFALAAVSGIHKIKPKSSKSWLLK